MLFHSSSTEQSTDFFSSPSASAEDKKSCCSNFGWVMPETFFRVFSRLRPLWLIFQLLFPFHLSFDAASFPGMENVLTFFARKIKKKMIKIKIPRYSRNELDISIVSTVLISIDVYWEVGRAWSTAVELSSRNQEVMGSCLSHCLAFFIVLSSKYSIS